MGPAPPRAGCCAPRPGRLCHFRGRAPAARPPGQDARHEAGHAPRGCRASPDLPACPAERHVAAQGAPRRVVGRLRLRVLREREQDRHGPVDPGGRLFQPPADRAPAPVRRASECRLRGPTRPRRRRPAGARQDGSRARARQVLGREARVRTRPARARGVPGVARPAGPAVQALSARIERPARAAAARGRASPVPARARADRPAAPAPAARGELCCLLAVSLSQTPRCGYS